MSEEIDFETVTSSGLQLQKSRIAFSFVVILTIGVLVFLVAILIKKSREETPYDRFNREAKEEMLKHCTNNLVGLSRLISVDLRHFLVGSSGELLKGDADDPHNWEGRVAAEYLNHVGGIDRTNFLFRFALETNEYRTPKICVSLDYDFMAIEESKKRAAEHEAWLKSLNRDR